MKISYKKLWKLLIDRDMSGTKLRIKAGISSVSLAKLGKYEGVTAAVLVKIYTVLNCNIGDIMDVIPYKSKKKVKKTPEMKRLNVKCPFACDMLNIKQNILRLRVNYEI